MALDRRFEAGCREVSTFIERQKRYLNDREQELRDIIDLLTTAMTSAAQNNRVIKTMLDFAAHHNIEPVTETFKFDDVNDAIARLREGKAHYRVVLTK